MRMNDTIYSAIRLHAESDPERTAIVEDGRSITYAGLDRLVDAIAHKISGKNAGDRIGIVMSHGIEMIAAMMAVLKSGAAYVPAEPSLPSDRIKYMMESAGVRLVIDNAFVSNLTAPESEIPDRSTPDAMAYILYTSGTSGRPKGVMVDNHNVVNYARAFNNEFRNGKGDVMLQCSVCSFDIFVEEVFATLINGATHAIPPVEISAGDVEALMGFVERHGVTMISGFPYLLAEMNRRKLLPLSLRLLISGGDVLRASYIDWLKEQGVAVYNTYGPSETTVCASYYRCDGRTALPDGTYPIGKAIAGVTIKIMGPHGNNLPSGTTGEICIFGDGVSRGYVGNPPESSNFFIDPDGNRGYRSGDIGYMLADGNIAFLHRKDTQVMILGKRVEPDEVENVLNESPDVERGVVCPFADDNGLAYLVAYFVPKHGKASLKVIRRWLASKLTDFMIPEFFVEMKSIPLTVRGKIDRASLPVVRKDGYRK